MVKKGNGNEDVFKRDIDRYKWVLDIQFLAQLDQKSMQDVVITFSLLAFNISIYFSQTTCPIRSKFGRNEFSTFYMIFISFGNSTWLTQRMVGCVFLM